MILNIILVTVGIVLGLVVSSLCQSAKNRDNVTISIEELEEMGEILHRLPIREHHKSLLGKDIALYRCPKCKSFVKEWEKTCECGNGLDWGEDEELNVNYDR